MPNSNYSSDDGTDDTISTDGTDLTSTNLTQPQQDSVDSTANRQYERSGLYPKDAQPFRLWALLGWNVLIIVIIAVISAILNNMLLPQ